MDDALLRILAGFSFCTGACIASFLNVVIWRVPRGESIAFPPSHCPKCNAPIRWYQNLPILSWLALRGRCANCRAPISPRYILIETLGGCLFLSAFWQVFGAAPAFHWFLAVKLLVWWIWISLMIVGSFIDFDHQLLPDFTTVGGMVLGVVAALIRTLFVEQPSPLDFTASLFTLHSSLLASLLGLAFGFGLLWLVRFLGSKAFGREAMGMGDVFLLGAVGALFGPVAVLVTLILSSVFGSVVGLSMVALSKTRLGRLTAIPYGPYICLGCIAWMFFGPEIVRAYLGFIGLK